MAILPRNAPRIAIVSSSERQRINLDLILSRSGLQVVLNQSPSREFLALACERKAEALLVDLDDEVTFGAELLKLLLGQSLLPMLLNDSVATRMDAGMVKGDWGRSLARKLAMLAIDARSSPLTPTSAPVIVLAPTPTLTSAPSTCDTPISTASHISPPPGVARVWVLGASIGGPPALMRFLSALAPDLPLACVLAQHIGANFITLFGNQLDQVSSFHVMPAQAGELLCRNQVVLAPVDEEIDIDAEGRIKCTPVSDGGALYKPSIDSVLLNIAGRYGKNSGAIIFSGMGFDGAKGVCAIAAHGGEVWAQDAASCLVSSMPDQARNTGLVSFSGTPEALAERLSQMPYPAYARASAQARGLRA